MSAMKPPRYLLREAIVRQLVRELRPAQVLELGYGRGDMLLTMARCGLRGVGFDPSIAARKYTQQRITEAGIQSFVLVDSYPRQKCFDAVLFFEVIGYMEDPVAWLADHRKVLKPDGRIIFSFTNDRHQGIAEKATGQMRCFNSDEMCEILFSAGYQLERMINYGYPLANLLRWVRALAYVGKNAATAPQCNETSDAQRQRQVQDSGFAPTRGWIRTGTVVFNSWLIGPFIWLQGLFRNTSAGTGFVVVARPLQD